MKKAVLHFESELNIISFHYDGINLSSGLPLAIKEIYSITEFLNSVITIQTNIGEEYIDFLGSMEIWGFDEKYLKELERKMSVLKASDIELKVS